MGDFDFIAEKVKSFKDAEEAKKANAAEERAVLLTKFEERMDLVEKSIKDVIFPVLWEAKKALVSSGATAEAETIGYTDASSGKHCCTGAKLQILTGKSKVRASTDAVNGPLLSFHGGFSGGTEITSKIEVWEAQPKEFSVIQVECRDVDRDMVKEQVQKLVDYAFATGE